MHFWFSNGLSMSFLSCHCKIVELQPNQSDSHPFEMINAPRLKTEPYFPCFLSFLSSKSTLKRSSLLDAHFTIKKRLFQDQRFWFLHGLYCSINFFKLLFGCPMAKFGLLLRGQSHSPNVNCCVLRFWPEGYREARNEVWVTKPSRGPNGVWTGNLPIPTITP